MQAKAMSQPKEHNKYTPQQNSRRLETREDFLVKSRQHEFHCNKFERKIIGQTQKQKNSWSCGSNITLKRYIQATQTTERTSQRPTAQSKGKQGLPATRDKVHTNNQERQRSWQHNDGASSPCATAISTCTLVRCLLFGNTSHVSSWDVPRDLPSRRRSDLLLGLVKLKSDNNFQLSAQGFYGDFVPVDVVLTLWELCLLRYACCCWMLLNVEDLRVLCGGDNGGVKVEQEIPVAVREVDRRVLVIGVDTDVGLITCVWSRIGQAARHPLQ